MHAQQTVALLLRPLTSALEHDGWMDEDEERETASGDPRGPPAENHVSDGWASAGRRGVPCDLSFRVDSPLGAVN